VFGRGSGSSRRDRAADLDAFGVLMLTTTTDTSITVTAAAPLAYVASRASADGPYRGRILKDRALAAALEAAGLRTHVSSCLTDLPATGDARHALESASLLVVDLVRPDRDLPVEVAVAATLGTRARVLVLVPDGIAIDGLAREVLRACRRIEIVRYQGSPARALADVLALEASEGRS
jgi:hypothetical protein